MIVKQKDEKKFTIRLHTPFGGYIIIIGESIEILYVISSLKNH